MKKPEIVIGTVKMLRKYGQNHFQVDRQESIKILEKSLELGINKIDTAESYGSIENLIPKSLLCNFEVTSKIDLDDKIPTWQIKKIQEKPHICNLLIHNADSLFELRKEDLMSFYLQKFRTFLGVSMYTPEYTRKAIDIGFESIQIPSNIVDNRWDYLNDFNNVRISGRSIFLQGILINYRNIIPNNIVNEYKDIYKTITLISEKLKITRLETLIMGACRSYVNSLVIGFSSCDQLIKTVNAFKNISDYENDIFIKTRNKIIMDPRQWK
jgi:aryl-alcohol dehydrogenase-like predicted oxidoreductase